MLLTFPQELIDSIRWKLGDILNIEVKHGCLYIIRVDD
jgi:hypothetical protein